MSAMSQIMDATYCIGGDMDFGRMFDQYLHKVSLFRGGQTSLAGFYAVEEI